MIEILLFFIGASLLLYVIFGGADYGAGILELLPTKFREQQKDVINTAMGPVWEANHMWLILVVVILFMGFPLVFTTLMTSLHIPMVALLIGIVIRGSAFTFRHYDAVQEERSQNVYTVLFGVSSLWTSLWLGIIVASLNRGLINPEARQFHEAYVQPWWGLYPLTMGIFVSLIFAFLASIYLIGETKDKDLKRIFTKRARLLNAMVVFAGGAVFLTSKLEGGHLFEEFFSNSSAIALMVIATGLLFVLWFFAKTKHTLLTRMVAAGQVTLILLGYYLIYAPNALITKQGPLSFYQAAAPAATQQQLVIALAVGSLFIFPSLAYLIKVFKGPDLRL